MNEPFKRTLNRAHWVTADLIDGHGDSMMLFIARDIRMLVDKPRYEYMGKPRKLLVTITKEDASDRTVSADTVQDDLKS